LCTERAIGDGVRDAIEASLFLDRPDLAAALAKSGSSMKDLVAAANERLGTELVADLRQLVILRAACAAHRRAPRARRVQPSGTVRRVSARAERLPAGTREG
jgi:hypothetical protein